MGLDLTIHTARGVVFDKENAFQLKQFLSKEDKKKYFSKREFRSDAELNYLRDDIGQGFLAQYSHLDIHSSYNYYSDDSDVDAVIVYAPSTLVDLNPLTNRMKPFAFTGIGLNGVSPEEKENFERLYRSFKEDSEVIDVSSIFWAEYDM